MKTLATIQKLAKVGKVLSKIMFIISIIGTVGTAIGIGGLAVFGEDGLQMSGVSVADIVQDETEMGIPAMIAAMVCGMVFWVAQIFISKFAENYFTNELADGTPFTARGAKELMRLGIINIAVSLGTNIICGIGLAIASAVIPDIEKAASEADGFSSVGLGIAFIICALLCRLGAEMKENTSETTETTENTEETAVQTETAE